MSDRLSRAIQRIAKSDTEISNAIKATSNRGDQPSSAGIGTSDSERDRICCDGSVSDDANPGTSTRDPDSGGQSGLDPGDPARLTSGDGTLSGVTDCATGEPVCMDGSGFIPPDGWDDIDQPPIDDNYVVGCYWYPVGNQGSRWPSPEAYLAANPQYIFWSTDNSGNCSGYVVRTRLASDIGIIGVTLTSASCGASTESYCTEVPRSANQWPSDGCVNLAIKGGSIVGSKYDPENDGSYSKPMSEIELCDGNGNSFKLAPSAGGGWKTISAQNPGDGYLYDSSGRQIARISESEYSDPNV